MKRFIILTIILLTSLIIYSQQNFKVLSSEVTISGTSTLHDWTAEVTDVSGSATFAMKDHRLEGISSLDIKMAGNSIKSEKGSMMDRNIYKALNVKDHPYLVFSMTQLNSISTNNGIYDVKLRGNLTIAGTTETLLLSATGQSDNTGMLVFRGEKKLKMSDYEVDPPEFMLGAMKTGDEVTIKFQVTLQTSEINPLETE